jgi:hypothetical protein
MQKIQTAGLGLVLRKNCIFENNVKTKNIDFE